MKFGYNDKKVYLLWEHNARKKMEFTVKETGNTFKAETRFRPILILTSNSEKDLPDAFLRRCLFYHITFPSESQLKDIVQKRFSDHPKFTPDLMESRLHVSCHDL